MLQAAEEAEDRRIQENAAQMFGGKALATKVAPARASTRPSAELSGADHPMVKLMAMQGAQPSRKAKKKGGLTHLCRPPSLAIVRPDSGSDDDEEGVSV